MIPGAAGAAGAAGGDSLVGNLATGMSLSSGIMGTISKAQEAQQASSGARQSAKLAENTAAANATIYRRGARRRMGSIRAAIGASGTTFDGSPLEILADQALEEEQQARIIAYQGQLQGSIYRAQAKQYDQAKQAAVIGGATDLGKFAALQFLLPGPPGTPKLSTVSPQIAPAPQMAPAPWNYGAQNNPYIPLDDNIDITRGSRL